MTSFFLTTRVICFTKIKIQCHSRIKNYNAQHVLFHSLVEFVIVSFLHMLLLYF